MYVFSNSNKANYTRITNTSQNSSIANCNNSSNNFSKFNQNHNCTVNMLNTHHQRTHSDFLPTSTKNISNNLNYPDKSGGISNSNPNNHNHFQNQPNIRFNTNTNTANTKLNFNQINTSLANNTISISKLNEMEDFGAFMNFYLKTSRDNYNVPSSASLINNFNSKKEKYNFDMELEEYEDENLYLENSNNMINLKNSKNPNFSSNNNLIHSDINSNNKHPKINKLNLSYLNMMNSNTLKLKVNKNSTTSINTYDNYNNFNLLINTKRRAHFNSEIKSRSFDEYISQKHLTKFIEKIPKSFGSNTNIKEYSTSRSKASKINNISKNTIRSEKSNILDRIYQNFIVTPISMKNSQQCNNPKTDSIDIKSNKKFLNDAKFQVKFFRRKISKFDNSNSNINLNNTHGNNTNNSMINSFDVNMTNLNMSNLNSSNLTSSNSNVNSHILHSKMSSNMLSREIGNNYINGSKMNTWTLSKRLSLATDRNSNIYKHMNNNYNYNTGSNLRNSTNSLSSIIYNKLNPTIREGNNIHNKIENSNTNINANPKYNFKNINLRQSMPLSGLSKDFSNASKILKNVSINLNSSDNKDSYINNSLNANTSISCNSTSKKPDVSKLIDTLLLNSSDRKKIRREEISNAMNITGNDSKGKINLNISFKNSSVNINSPISNNRKNDARLSLNNESKVNLKYNILIDNFKNIQNNISLKNASEYNNKEDTTFIDTIHEENPIEDNIEKNYNKKASFTNVNKINSFPSNYYNKNNDFPQPLQMKENKENKENNDKLDFNTNYVKEAKEVPNKLNKKYVINNINQTQNPNLCNTENIFNLNINEIKHTPNITLNSTRNSISNPPRNSTTNSSINFNINSNSPTTNCSSSTLNKSIKQAKINLYDNKSNLTCKENKETKEKNTNYTSNTVTGTMPTNSANVSPSSTNAKTIKTADINVNLTKKINNQKVFTNNTNIIKIPLSGSMSKSPDSKLHLNLDYKDITPEKTPFKLKSRILDKLLYNDIDDKADDKRIKLKFSPQHDRSKRALGNKLETKESIINMINMQNLNINDDEEFNFHENLNANVNLTERVEKSSLGIICGNTNYKKIHLNNFQNIIKNNLSFLNGNNSGTINTVGNTNKKNNIINSNSNTNINSVKNLNSNPNLNLNENLNENFNTNSISKSSNHINSNTNVKNSPILNKLSHLNVTNKKNCINLPTELLKDKSFESINPMSNSPLNKNITCNTINSISSIPSPTTNSSNRISNRVNFIKKQSKTSVNQNISERTVILEAPGFKKNPIEIANSNKSIINKMNDNSVNNEKNLGSTIKDSNNHKANISNISRINEKNFDNNFYSYIPNESVPAQDRWEDECVFSDDEKSHITSVPSFKIKKLENYNVHVISEKYDNSTNLNNYDNYDNNPKSSNLLSLEKFSKETKSIQKIKKKLVSKFLLNQSFLSLFTYNSGIKDSLLNFLNYKDLVNLSLSSKYLRRETIYKIYPLSLNMILNENSSFLIRIKIWKSIYKHSKLNNLHNLKKEYIENLSKKSKYEEDILKDMNRTFPEDPTFKPGKINHKKLFNILIAYSNYNPIMGYAQGLNFLVANALLILSEEEEVFIFIDSLVNKFEFNSLIGVKNPTVRCKLEEIGNLLNIYTPELITYLEENLLNHEFFTTSWVITLFSNSVKKYNLFRIWDLFLVYGWKFLNFFIVSVMTNFSGDIINQDPNRLSVYMKNLLKSDLFDQSFRYIVDYAFELFVSIKNY